MIKTKRRIAILIFTVIFILTGIGALIVPLTKITSSAALVGAGSEESPYRISTVADFKAFRDDVNAGNSYEGKYVQLTADLDLKYATFTPIGLTSATAFKGNFDGNNHSIKGISVAVTNAATTNNYVGLFGNISGATVKNFKLEDANISVISATGAAGTKGSANKAGNAGKAAVNVYAGGVAAKAVSSKISNVQVSGFVYAYGGTGGAGGEGGTRSSNGTGTTGGAGGRGADSYSGGLVALADSCVISDCSFVGSVFAQSGAGGAGGNGYNARGSNYAGGKGGAGGVAGTAMGGGLVAKLYNDAKTVTDSSVSDSYSNAYIRVFGGAGGNGGAGRSCGGTARGGAGGAAKSRPEIYAGGVVGEFSGTIANCFAVGSIDMRGTRKGMPGNGGYGTNNSAGDNAGAVGAVETTNPYAAAGGVVARVIGDETSTNRISYVYSDVDLTEAHPFYYYTGYNTRLGGIVGVIDSKNTEITSAVSLSQHYEAEKTAVGNAFSPFATYVDNEVAAAVQGVADDIRYPDTVNYINQNNGEHVVTDFSTMGERSKAITSLGNLSMGADGVFGNFNKDLWQIDGNINEGRPTLKKVNFKAIEKQVYNVSNRSELLAIANTVSSGKPLMDVTINILDDFDLGSWTPIGVSLGRSIPFLVINGNNHTLTNMSIEKTTDFKGLVGYGTNLTVSDLSIQDPVISGAGGDYVGGIAGVVTTSGQFYNCHVTQSSKPSAQNSVITGKRYVGGIVGDNVGYGRTGEIIDCSNTVKIRCATASSTTTSLYVGGLAGIVYNTKVERCYSTADVVCDTYNTALTYYAAAFIGGLFWSSSTQDCFATGNLTTAYEGSYIGYVDGSSSDGYIVNNYYTGSVIYNYGGTALKESSAVRFGGIVARLRAGTENAKFRMTGNAALYKSLALKSKTTTPQHRRIGDLFASIEPYRYTTEKRTSKNVKVSYGYIRDQLITDKNYYNKSRTRAAGNTYSTSIALHGYFHDKSTQVTAYDYYVQTAADKLAFWQDTIGYDFDGTWEWNEALEMPVLKTNKYNVPGMGGSAIEIATAEDLATFRDSVNAGYTYAGKTVKLVADIDLSGMTWEPIGNKTTVVFSGIFDGDGHTISNAFVNKASDCKGLFGAISGAQIKNLTVKNPTIASTAFKYTGGIVGWLSASQMYNCKLVGGSVAAGADSVGGVAGYVSGAGVVIEKCGSVYDPDASANTNLTQIIKGNNHVGGLIGNVVGTAAANVTVTECYSSRTVCSAVHYAGGLIGSSAGAKYSRCYATGSVYSINGTQIGGLIGRMVTVAGTVTDCFATGDVLSYCTTSSAYAGGLIGLVGITNCQISNCLVAGSVSSCVNVASKHSGAGGITGLANVKTTQIGGCAVVSEKITASNLKTINNTSYFAYSGYFGNGYTTGVPSCAASKTNFYSSDVLLGARTSGNTTTSYNNSIRTDRGAVAKESNEFKTQALYASEQFGLSWDFYEVWEIQEGVNGGYPYLKALGAPVHDLGSKFNPIQIKVKQDYIDFANNINNGVSCYEGLHVQQVEDISLSGVDRAGFDVTHSFAGTYDGGNNKLTDFQISDSANCLGLFGYTKFATLKNINLVKPRVAQTGTGASYVGGIVGYSLGNLLIDSCAVSGGTVSAQGGNVGGMIGAAAGGYSVIQKSFATATVNGGKSVGGLVGYFRLGNLRRCYTRGDVTGNLANGHSSGGVAGLIGHFGKVEDCYAIGNISDTSASVSAFAGGVVGRIESSAVSTSVMSCYFNGTVTATITTNVSTKTTTTYAAGIVGYNNGKSAVIKDNASLATAYVLNTPAKKSAWQSAQIVCRSTTTATTHSGNFAISNKLVPYKNYNLNYGIHATTQIGATATTVDEALDEFRSNCVTLLPSWNINTGDVWEVNEGLNNGFPALKDLPPDNSELDVLIDTAKTYRAMDWNVPTFTALQDAIKAAEEASEAGTLTDELKAFHIKALNDGIANLRPDTTALQALYDEWKNEEEIKDWYVNFATMSSSLALSKQILDEDSNLYKNADVQLTLSTLQMAVDNLIVNKVKLDDAIKKAGLVIVNEKDYAAEDIVNLKEVLKRATAVRNDDNATARQVKAMTEELEATIAELKVDKTNLASRIQEAYTDIGGTVRFEGEKGQTVVLSDDNNEKLSDEKFVDITQFNAALNYAVEIFNNLEATGAEVTKAVYDLGVALYNLTIDKKPLSELYNLASLKKEGKYTAESWQTFSEALAAAKTVIDSAPATPDKLRVYSAGVDKAYDDLKNAYDGLTISIAQLEKLLADAQKEIDTNEAAQGSIYSEDSINDLKLAMQTAQAIVDRVKDADKTNDPTSEEIDDAAENLNEAILNLTINIEFLKTKIAEAEKYLAEGVAKYYTTESITALTEAKANAEKFIDSYNKNEYENDQAAIVEAKTVTKALQLAIKGLAANEPMLQDYIDMVKDPAHENYIGNVKYAQESVDIVTALADSSSALLASSEKTNESIIKAINDFEYAFAHMKGDKTELIEKVGEVSTWTNSKHRQDNEGKWILDDKGELKVFVVYIKETWDNLQAELTEAQQVVNNSAATVEEVETAYTDLISAIDSLRIDDSELALRIQKAETRLNSVDKKTGQQLFTEETCVPVREEKTKSEAVMERIALGTITLDEVQAQLDALNKAIDSMIINPEYINAYIRKAETQLLPQEGYEDNNAKYYTEMTFRLLETQTNLVKGLINDNICEDDLYDFVDMLVSAMTGLEVTTAPLDEQIYAADDLDSDYITDATYQVVSQAVADAQSYLATGKWVSDDYDVKFAAVSEMRALVERIKNAILLIEVDKTAYNAFIASKEPLLKEKYEQEGLDALGEAIAAAKDAPNYTVDSEEHEAFNYYVAMDHINAVINAEKALRPDVSELQNRIDGIIEEMNKHHVAPLEDEDGNVIPETIDPEYIGVVMYTYEYYTTISYNNLLAAISAARTVVNNSADYTIADVEQELTDLNSCYSALVLDKSLLEELVNECNSLDAKNYHEDSFNAFKAALEKSKGYLNGNDNVIANYVTAYNNLLEAKEALEFNTSALTALIEKANTLIEASNKSEGEEGKRYFTKSTFDALNNALQAAYDFDPNASEGDEGGATAGEEAYRIVCKNLSEAIDGIIDIGSLKAKIEEGKTYTNDDNKYDESAFASLQQAIAAGVTVYEDEKATKASIDEAILNIEIAIRTLSLGTSTLDEIISRAEEILNCADAQEPIRFFVTVTLPELRDKLDDAKKFRDSGSTDILAEFDVKSALYDAINGVVELTELKAKLDAANAFVAENPNNGKWTSTSYNTLKEVIAVAEKVYRDSVDKNATVGATAEEVAEQVTNLTDIHGYLVEVPEDAYANSFELIDDNLHYKFVDESGAEKSEHYVDDPAFLINIALYDSIADVMSQFNNIGIRAFRIADGVETEITDYEGTYVATGIVLRIYKDGEVVDELTLVVKGDVNGDGEVDMMDKAQLNAYTIGNLEFSGCYLLACDVNSDGEIDMMDKAQLNAYTIGNLEIYEGLSVKENN